MWLVGMMGSGKSTVGAAAAARLGVRFYDTDVMVSDMTRRTIADLWASEGERAFRRWETLAIENVPGDACIAAAGGGAVIEPANRQIMRTSTVVWLQCDPIELARRLRGATDRPLLHDGEPEERLISILHERSGMFERLADHVIDTTDLSAADAVDRVVSLWAP
jgi:shikimate kinase